MTGPKVFAGWVLARVIAVIAICLAIYLSGRLGSWWGLDGVRFLGVL
jgi:hypothetical protein